jgi:ABC-type bacteriocin/lantibiotic exporter with double-glycine peptidase domain
MNSWFAYLKKGLSRKIPKDRIASKDGHSDIRTNLKNLRPFVSRYWRKGLLGGLLILLTSLLGFPQPLINRYLIDKVILGRQLALLAGAILLLIGITLAEKLTSLLQEFYFARFEQEVIRDIQHGLLDRALRLGAGRPNGSRIQRGIFLIIDNAFFNSLLFV